MLQFVKNFLSLTLGVVLMAGCNFFSVLFLVLQMAHVDGRSLNYWTLAIAISSFYGASLLLYLKLSRDHQKVIAEYAAVQHQVIQEQKALSRQTRLMQNQLNQSDLQARQLNRELEAGNLALTLSYTKSFLHTPRYDETHMMIREWEFEIKNESLDQDAFEVYFQEFHLSSFTIHARHIPKVQRGTAMPVEYSVVEKRGEILHGVPEYETDLEWLLDREYKGRLLGPLDILSIDITMRYKNAFGVTFEASFELQHSPAVLGMPRFNIRGCKRI